MARTGPSTAVHAGIVDELPGFRGETAIGLKFKVRSGLHDCLAIETIDRSRQRSGASRPQDDALPQSLGFPML
jgi:hypothetical protein